jgi:UDP:flavonoid glycosyltransferase YjiC (YdhE family)
MSDKKLTVLFTPMDGFGHINGCHGIAERLRDRGHRVVFALDKKFKARLEKYGFQEEHLITGTSEPVGGVDPTFHRFNENKQVFKGTPKDVAQFSVTGYEVIFKSVQVKDIQYKAVIDRVKPDIIFIDSYIASPVILKSGIPWVWLYSASPLMVFNNDKLPPAWSG